MHPFPDSHVHQRNLNVRKLSRAYLCCILYFSCPEYKETRNFYSFRSCGLLKRWNITWAQCLELFLWSSGKKNNMAASISHPFPAFWGQRKDNQKLGFTLVLKNCEDGAIEICVLYKPPLLRECICQPSYFTWTILNNPAANHRDLWYVMIPLIRISPNCSTPELNQVGII